MKTVTTVLTLLMFLAGCDQAPPVATAPTAAPQSAPAQSNIEQVVANPDRPENDRSRDGNRKPAEVLAFFEISPGMTILDMFSGGGYYTELLSRVVGPEGRIYAHSNAAYAQFVGEEATTRYANDRLGNVEILMAENNALELPAESFDAIMMVLAYHDIYYVDPTNGWPKIDGPRLIAEFYEGLKPGGILAVVDHYAEAGSPRETGNTLHRIDPDIVIAELEAAGFVLEDKSDVLRNMDDDLSLSMSAPEVRGKTDRFVFRFRKPGQLPN